MQIEPSPVGLIHQHFVTRRTKRRSLCEANSSSSSGVSATSTEYVNNAELTCTPYRKAELMVSRFTCFLRRRRSVNSPNMSQTLTDEAKCTPDSLKNVSNSNFLSAENRTPILPTTPIFPMCSNPSDDSPTPDNGFSKPRRLSKSFRSRKRICFQPADQSRPLSAIQECSPYEDRTLTRHPNPSPNPSNFRTPTKPIPKTNPRFSVPRTNSRSRPNLNRRSSLDLDSLISKERVSSYYDGDGVCLGKSQPDIRACDSKDVSLQRVVAGLKTFGIKGEIYLSMLLNRRLLTITVDEGRNFAAPTGSECNSYVRLSLVPDEEKRTQCRTALFPRSNHPSFNQTFTLELLPEDWSKRLLISVWHRDLSTQKSALLGCMTFSVKSLMQAKKAIDGWYFLLAPSYGRQKHLAVDKVTMLTYYGSVDFGLQRTGSSGYSTTSQITL